MIGRLHGRVLELAPGEVVIDAGGVGYAVRIPLSTYYELVDKGKEPASLLVHTYVREDALLLFGFASRQERELFELLLAISGVGPRMALAVLSGIGVAELERAVLDGDRDRLQRIPGIGRKTAERILLELGDRLSRPGERRADKRGGRTEGAGGSGLRDDALSALVNLGYSREAARKAVERALEEAGPDPALEQVLRAALQGLVA